MSTSSQTVRIRQLVDGAPAFDDALDAKLTALADEAEAAKNPRSEGRDAPFAVVPISDLGHQTPEAPTYWWEDYVPSSVVTLLGAHGGVGKSTLALMLGIAIATGRDLFNVPTRRGVVVLFSAEDGAALVRYRLHRLCSAMGVDVAELIGRLHILDATDGDPTLFCESASAGKRYGVTTATYDALRQFVEQVAADVLIVDNASDTFDAGENDRSRVRGFMRSLAALAHPARGVVLLAHVDKATARGQTNGLDAYTGSTAWHNSARSRLYLSRNAEGGLTLEHQKANLSGKPREPLVLRWPEGGIPTVDEPPGPFLQGITDRSDTRALLTLIHDFYSRGEWIAPDVRSRYNAAKVLKGEGRFPARRRPAEVFALLRGAERAGLLCRETYRDRNRKEHERWALTAQGADLIGAAPCAPSAPSTEHGAPYAPSAQGAPCAPCAHRGYGGIERTPNTARGVTGVRVADGESCPPW